MTYAAFLFVFNRRAYRQLLRCHFCPSSNTNSTVQDSTGLLALSHIHPTLTTMPGAPQILSEFNCNVVAYIVGFVVRTLLKSSKCAECMEALVQHPVRKSGVPAPDLYLVHLRDNGGLIYPSDETLAVCKSAERVFRMYNDGQPSPMSLTNANNGMPHRANDDWQRCFIVDRSC